MGRIFKFLIALGLLIWLATTLTNLFIADPLGMTTRANIHSHTAIETTRLETEAAVDVAQAEAQAKIESANAAAEAKKVQAQEQRKSSQTWANTMPILLLILVAGGAAWLIILYRGRMMLILAARGVFDGVPHLFLPGLRNISQQLPGDIMSRDTVTAISPEDELERYAAQHNQHILKRNGYYLLVDKRSNQVVKQLALK